MSVIIKSMKMPENCEKCPIREGTFCDIINKDIDLFYSGSIKRDPDCPLVELPEHHGDLVDINEIRWDDHYDSDGNLSSYQIAYSDEMPDVIIEAE